MTTQTGAAGIESDDFQCGGSIDTGIWTFDGGTSGTLGYTGQGTADAGITLTMPSTDGDYLFWTGGVTPVMLYQACSDADFTIEARFTDDAVSGAERWLFAADATFTNVALIGWYDGPGNLFSGNFVDSGSSATWSDTNPTVTDRRIRLQHVASSSVFSGSYYNGSSFTAYGNSAALFTPAWVGIAISNNVTDTGDVADIDYFFETSAIISPEDDLGGGPPPRRRIFLMS